MSADPTPIPAPQIEAKSGPPTLPTAPPPPEAPEVTTPLPQGQQHSQAPLPQPVVKEERKYTLHYPMDSKFSPMGNGTEKGKKVQRGVAPGEQSVVGWINDAAKSSQASRFSIEIMRRLPAVHEGVRLKQGIVQAFSQLVPFSVIHDSVEQTNGGGDYGVNVLNEDGELVQSCRLRVDGYPLITPEDEAFAASPTPGRGVRLNDFSGRSGDLFGSFSRPGARPGGLYGAAPSSPELEEFNRAKLKEAQTMQETKNARAEADRLTQEERLERMRNKDFYEKKEREERESRERQVREEREAKERQAKEERDTNLAQQKVEREQSTLEKMLLAVLGGQQQKPVPDTGMKEFVSVFGESMKTMFLAMQQQNDTNMKMMLGMLQSGKDKPNDPLVTELVKTQLAAATNSNTRFDKIIEMMFSKRLEDGDPVQRISQTVDIINKLRGDVGGGDDEWFNPEEGFLTNAGNGILVALKNLVQGGGRHVLGAINSVLGKPASNAQFSESELAPVAQALAQRGYQAAPDRKAIELPAPQGIDAEAPVRLPQDPRAPSRRPLVTPSGFQVVANPSALERAVKVVPTPEPAVKAPAVIVESPARAVPAPTPVVQSVEQEETLSYWVNEAVAAMIDDLEAGRRDQDWPEVALGKWNGGFLDRLTRAHDDSERINLIREKADPELFKKLYDIIVSPQNWRVYNFWLEALHRVVSEHAAGNASAA